MQTAYLPDRGVIRLTGEDAAKFLQGLVTCDVDKAAEGAAFGALLTPQGKIVVDFLLVPAPAEIGGGFLIDAPRALAPDLARKLGFYKLRVKVAVEDQSDRLGVTAFWGGETPPEVGGLLYRDPRHPRLGWRVVAPLPVEAPAGTAAYDAHRIGLGIPAGGRDFVYGDTFPHEADMDQLGGVDFKKGCYVGQEVVSRMQHRGTARTRVVPVIVEGPAPEEGAAVTAGETMLGAMGSAAEGRGLARLRLDRLEEALARGAAVEAGGIALRPDKPDWARFAWPGEAVAAG